MAELRRLKEDEYYQLKNVAEGYIPDPRNSVVLLAEEDGTAVGRTMLLAPTHIEGTWVAEGHRNRTILKQLIHGIELEAQAEGIKELFSYAPNEKIGNYLERLGYVKSPLTVYVKELSPCR